MPKFNYLYLFFISFLFCNIGCSQNKTPVAEKSIKIVDTIQAKEVVEIDTLGYDPKNLKFYKKNAHASYYGGKFHGRRTASGAKYDKNKLTAAHKKLPFGTKLKVTNESNGRSLVVTVTDRGPFVKGREIDLSEKAFMTLASKKGRGIMNVTLEIVK